jgi:copper resistance protein C
MMAGPAYKVHLNKGRVTIMLTGSRFLTVAGMLGASLILSAPVFAHAALVASDPPPNSTVGAPKEIRLTFSEKIAPAFSGFGVSMGEGMTVKLTGRMGDDGKTIIGTPTSPLHAGTWKVSWHAASIEDGHRMEGSFDFTVK